MAYTSENYYRELEGLSATPTAPLEVTNKNTVGWQDLYRLEHGLAPQADVYDYAAKAFGSNGGVLPETYASSPIERAKLYLKYDSINPDAIYSYDKYWDQIGDTTYSDQGAYNAAKSDSDRMEKLTTVYNQNRLYDLAAGQVPTYNTILPAYNAYTVVPTYAEGGNVNLEQLKAAGRGGDTELALTTAREREMLRQMGGAGTINPNTGLREYKGGSAVRVVDSNTQPTIDAATLNTGLTAASPIASTGTYTAPTLRTVSSTDKLAPSGGNELQKLMRAYGVSTASANPYGGSSAPAAVTATQPTAPTALTGMVSPNQVSDYNTARDAYNTQMGTYNADVARYNTALNKYALDQAKYDQYTNEYNKRMTGPFNIYNQTQFGGTGLYEPDNILLSPTYAAGGSVKGYADGASVTAPYGSNENIAALAERYRGANESFMDMLNQSLESPEQARAAKQQMYFNLARSLASPTKTGTFGETLAGAAGVMGDYAETKREAELNKIKLRMEAQKYQAAMAKEDLGAALDAQKNAQELQYRQNQLMMQLGQQQETARHNRAIEGTAAVRAQAAVEAARNRGTSTKPLTEAQSKAVTYGMRMQEANNTINTVGAGGSIQPSRLKQYAERMPGIGGVIGELVNVTPGIKPSGAQQQVEQAELDFLLAVLRKESGATIRPDEYEMGERQYFPRPGDGPGVIKQKARNRELAVRGMMISAGPGVEQMGAAAPTARPAARKVRRTGTYNGRKVIEYSNGDVEYAD